MEKKVLISVKTMQQVDGVPEEIELITEGIYKKDGDEFLAIYDESEISGMDGTTTIMKIQEDALTITRKGTTNSELVFKMGLEHISMYSTPFGVLEVTIKPSKVNIDVTDKGGDVDLEYVMEAIGLDIIENALKLNIKDVN